MADRKRYSLVTYIKLINIHICKVNRYTAESDYFYMMYMSCIFLNGINIIKAGISFVTCRYLTRNICHQSDSITRINYLGTKFFRIIYKLYIYFFTKILRVHEYRTIKRTKKFCRFVSRFKQKLYVTFVRNV